MVDVLEMCVWEATTWNSNGRHIEIKMSSLSDFFIQNWPAMCQKFNKNEMNMIFDDRPLENSSLTIPGTTIPGSTIAVTTIPIIQTPNHNLNPNANPNPNPNPKFSSEKCRYWKCRSRKWCVTLDKNVYCENGGMKFKMTSGWTYRKTLRHKTYHWISFIYCYVKHSQPKSM